MDSPAHNRSTHSEGRVPLIRGTTRDVVRRHPRRTVACARVPRLPVPRIAVPRCSRTSNRIFQLYTTTGSGSNSSTRRVCAAQRGGVTRRAHAYGEARTHPASAASLSRFAFANTSIAARDAARALSTAAAAAAASAVARLIASAVAAAPPPRAAARHARLWAPQCARWQSRPQYDTAWHDEHLLDAAAPHWAQRDVRPPSLLSADITDSDSEAFCVSGMQIGVHSPYYILSPGQGG